MQATNTDIKILKNALGIRNEQEISCEYHTTSDFLLAFISVGNSFENAFTHSHEEYEFIIPVQSLVDIGDITTVYLIPPNCSHTTNGGESKYISLVFNKEYFETVCHSKSINGFFEESGFFGNETLKTLLTLFRTKATLPFVDDSNFLEPLKQLICAELIELASEKLGKIPDIRQNTFANAITYINEHFDREISVEELADVCGVSHCYFTNCFKQIYGETPKTYITKTRINKAKAYLRSSDMSIGEIAEKCGFNHLNSFTVCFRTNEGISPTEYRNLHKK